VLTAYQNATAALLQNPPAPTPLYSTANLTTWINTARGQLSGEADCIRAVGSLALTAGTRVYPFSAITYTGSSGTTGIEGPLHVRTAWRTAASGQLWMRPRPFEWYSLYELNLAVPTEGPPVMWAQYGQGVAGTIYVSPVPDQAYTMVLDMVCYPIPLVDDTTVEAIPYMWTDAVPFFAAFYALMSAQSTARDADADKMLQRYQLFVQRARNAATPAVLSGIYDQQPPLVRQGQLGNPGQQQGGPSQ
jgi:hypothetical protein